MPVIKNNRHFLLLKVIEIQNFFRIEALHLSV